MYSGSFKIRPMKIAHFLYLNHEISQKSQRKHVFFIIFLKTTHQKLSNAPLMVKFGHREGSFLIFDRFALAKAVFDPKWGAETS